MPLRINGNKEITGIKKVIKINNELFVCKKVLTHFIPFLIIYVLEGLQR